MSPSIIHLLSIESLDLHAHFGGYGDLSRPIQTTLEPHEVTKSPQKRPYRGIEKSRFFNKKFKSLCFENKCSEMYPDTSKVHENHPAPPFEPFWVHGYIAKERNCGRLFVLFQNFSRQLAKGSPNWNLWSRRNHEKQRKLFHNFALWRCIHEPK